MKRARRSSAWLGALIVALIALVGTGWAPVQAAAGAQVKEAPQPGLTPRAPDEAPGAPEQPLDCAVGDVEADPRHGIDDRCELWAVVYDDPELYDDSLWTYTNEPTAGDELHEMAIDPTGERVFTLGRSCRNSSPGQCRWAIVAHRADTGDELWVAREWRVELVDLAVSGDGTRVYASGSVPAFRRLGDGDPLFNTEVLTIAWKAATGQKLWERTYSTDPVGHREGDPHNLHSEDAGVAVAAAPSGDRIYVTGYSDNRDGFYDILVIAYDGASGTRKWVATYDTSSSDRPYVPDEALPQLAEVSPDGTTLHLAARAGSEPLLLAYQAHDPQSPAGDGTLRWVSDDLSGTPQSLDLAPDGSRIYLREGPRIAAYEAATGAPAWPSRPEYVGGEARALAISPAGDRIYVAGGSTINGYDAATGVEEWVAQATTSNATGGGSINVDAVGVSVDGTRVYVTGTGGGSGGVIIGEQATVAFDAATDDPGPSWSALYGRLLDSEAGRLLAVGPDGTVFTAGTLAPRGVDFPFVPRLPTKNLADWGVQAYAP